MDWARMLAYVTGTVDRELLSRNEYLTAENRILKAQFNGCLKLSDAERSMLGEIGHRLGRNGSRRGRNCLARYRKLVAHKFDGSKAHRGPGRPRVTRKVEQLIVRLAEENRDWGYDRIAGALPIWDIVYAIRRSAMSRDALDGVADGVIDNPPACKAKFDPATATYTAGGATFPLQCTGPKDATCLSPAQIHAAKSVISTCLCF
jgi:hypothetical protein